MRDLGIVREDHTPGLQHISPVGHIERLERILLDEKDGGAAGVDLADDREDLLDEDRRQAKRRFVEEQHLGLVMMARPIASICCSPPDSVPPFWPARSRRRGKIA
jgi:hypothetical protein